MYIENEGQAKRHAEQHAFDHEHAQYLLPIVYSREAGRSDFAVILYKYMALVKSREGVNLTQYGAPFPFTEDEAALLDMIDKVLNERL